MQDMNNGILPERQSIACFSKLRREITVKPIKNCITQERPRVYEDLTGLELLR